MSTQAILNDFKVSVKAVAIHSISGQIKVQTSHLGE